MVSLKNLKQKRWYRIKDGIIYDILTTSPSKNMIMDYIASSNNNCLLPYIKVYYGKIQNETLEEYPEAIEKLYLDVFIEKGDLVIQNGDTYSFSPYVNNGEYSENGIFASYMKIHEYSIKKFILSEVLNNTSKETILNSIPFYNKTVNKNNVHIITPQTINGKKVNCIYKIELINDTLNEIYDFQEYYKEIVIDIVNNNCYEIADKILNKQLIDLSLPIHGKNYKYQNIIAESVGEILKNTISLSIFPEGNINFDTKILTLGGTLGKDCTKVIFNNAEVPFTYEESDCSELSMSVTTVDLSASSTFDTITLEFYYENGRDSLEGLIKNINGLISLDLTEFDISEIKNMCSLCENCTPSEIEHKGILFKSAPLSYVGPKRNDDLCFDENGEEDETYAPFYNYNGKVKVPADRMELFTKLFDGLNDAQIENL